MEETLTCESCQKQWSRQRSRGRKPRLCPSCLFSDQPVINSTPKETLSSKNTNPKTSDSSLDLSVVYSALLPKNPKADSLFESTKNGSTWKCPSCGNTITMHVPITDIPTHRCTPNMVSVKRYERIK